MSTELTLRYAGLAELESDFESNLQKGRAFVPGATGLAERQYCELRIEHPHGGAPLCLPAEAVWINDDAENGGTGIQLVSFGADVRDVLKAFVTARLPAAASGEMPRGVSTDALPAAETSEHGPSSESPSVRNLHDRIRDLSINDREVLARQGGLPERVALERRFGSSVWEGLLHNPQLTPREVLRMAKSTSLPTALVNLIVANKGWLADAAIQSALLQNPRVAGAHLDRVLRALSQAELLRISEQTSVRLQVRQGAKRLIRR